LLAPVIAAWKAARLRREPKATKSAGHTGQAPQKGVRLELSDAKGRYLSCPLACTRSFLTLCPAPSAFSPT